MFALHFTQYACGMSISVERGFGRSQYIILTEHAEILGVFRAGTVTR